MRSVREHSSLTQMLDCFIYWWRRWSFWSPFDALRLFIGCFQSFVDMVLVFVPRLSSIIAQPAVSALVDLCIHVCPPRCFKLGDKRSKWWRRQDILCKTAKEMHKNKQNCRWALFVFPFEVLPFHSRLDDPTALDHKQWEDVDQTEWMKKRGVMYVYTEDTK